MLRNYFLIISKINANLEFLILKKIKLMKVLLYIFLIFNFSCLIAQKSNFSIIDSIVNNAVAQFSNDFKNDSNFNIFLNIENNEYRNLLERNILKNYPNHSFITIADSNFLSLKPNISHIEINYNKLKNNEELCKRAITIGFSVIYNKNKKTNLIADQQYTYSDTVRLDELEKLQTSPFKYDKTTIPEPESSFYQNIIQPLIFIGSAIITIALLFTTRSN